MKQAYYTSTIIKFLKELPQTILGHLAEHHPHDLDPLQRNAWVAEITLLQDMDAGSFLSPPARINPGTPSTSPPPAPQRARAGSGRA